MFWLIFTVDFPLSVPAVLGDDSLIIHMKYTKKKHFKNTLKFIQRLLIHGNV